MIKKRKSQAHYLHGNKKGSMVLLMNRLYTRMWTLSWCVPIRY